MHLKLPDDYPYDLNSRFQQDFPNTSRPDVWSDAALAEFGIFPVTPTQKPDFVFQEQALMELPPQQVNGVWTQVWSVIERTQEEKQAMTDGQASSVRAERDRKLREECDCINPMRWESMTDAQKDLARNHRQALLDVTNQAGFPWSITWPQNPL
jgi:hypothetical protein